MDKKALLKLFDQYVRARQMAENGAVRAANGEGYLKRSRAEDQAQRWSARHEEIEAQIREMLGS